MALVSLAAAELTEAEEAKVRADARAKFEAQVGKPPMELPEVTISAKKPAAKKKSPVKKAASAVKSALTAPAAMGDDTKKLLGYGLMAVGLGLVALQLFGHHGGRRVARNPRRRKRRERVVRNPREPSSGNPDVQKAIDFRREFHWGYPARRVERRKVSPTPKVLVELGKVSEITYRTKKKGEKARLFSHDFEGKLPTLAMDVRNKRLHFVGGSYTVTADGITG